MKMRLFISNEFLVVMVSLQIFGNPNVVYAQGGLYGGTPLDSGKPLLAKNGKITLKDTLENLYPKLPDITTEPLGYNGYIYDASSRTALLATNNEGYVVGPNDPLVKIPVTSALRSKFIGAHSNVNYDPTVGENGALVVYYQAQKVVCGRIKMTGNFQLHYAIDPVLLPYLEKKKWLTQSSWIKLFQLWG